MKTYYEKKLLTTDDQLQPSEPYEYSPQHNETLLNDTIDQLDVLEQKISVIMEKNA